MSDRPDDDRALREAESQPPRGTLFLMLLFLMAFFGMWGYLYFLMLGRG